MDGNFDFFNNILDNIYDGVYYVNREKQIKYWNKAAEELTGYKKSEVSNKCCADNILMHVNGKGENLCLSQCPLSMTIKDGKKREADVYLHQKNGYRLPVTIRISPIYDDSGKISGAVEIFSDNSSKIVMEEKMKDLEEKALNDPLTGIGNRRYIDINLLMKLEEMHRYGWKFGLIMSDVDNFKAVNDNYGHDIGDEVLKMVARTYLNSLRPFDIVGRFGGDEFLAIIQQADNEKLYCVADRFRLLIEKSEIPVDFKAINITVSVGCAVVGSKDTEESLIKKVDSLLYSSKNSGKNKITMGL